jgi:hypothetical protein
MSSSLSMAALERLRAGGKSLPRLGVQWLTMTPDRRTIGPDHCLGSIGDRLQLCTSPAYIVPLCPRASFLVRPGTKNAARSVFYEPARLRGGDRGPDGEGRRVAPAGRRQGS